MDLRQACRTQDIRFSFLTSSTRVGNLYLPFGGKIIPKVIVLCPRGYWTNKVHDVGCMVYCSGPRFRLLLEARAVVKSLVKNRLLQEVGFRVLGLQEDLLSGFEHLEPCWFVPLGFRAYDLRYAGSLVRAMSTHDSHRLVARVCEVGGLYLRVGLNMSYLDPLTLNCTQGFPEDG